MRSLLLLLLSALTLSAASTNVTFRWDPGSPSDVIATYRLYELIGGGRTLLATVTAAPGAAQPTNAVTIFNWQLGASRTVTCTSSNAFGESPASIPLVVPPGPPSAPINLAPIPLTLLMPYPGTAEISTDLANWRQRIQIVPSPAPGEAILTFVTYPNDPLLFMRTKQPPTLTAPPIPR